MSETLWIRLNAAAGTGAPLDWARLDGAGRVVARGRDAADGLPSGTACRAVAAAEKVRWTRIEAPGRRRLEGAALAYALEDRLAESPESVQAVMGAVGRDGTGPVAVVERAWLAGALAELASAGVRPASVVPEPALFPDAERDEWHAVWGDQAWLRLPDGLCLSLVSEPAQARDWLRLAIERADLPPGRLVLHAEPGCVPPTPEMLAAGLSLAVESGPEYDWAMAAQSQGRPDIDLLSGDFARRGQSGVDLRAWRPAAWLAVGFVLVNLAGFMFVSGGKAWERQHIARANQARLMAAFPDTKVVVEPVVQMRRKVAELEHRTGHAAPSDFLPLLVRAGQALPDAARGGVRSLRYGPAGLVLVLPRGQAGTVDWAAAGLHATVRPAEGGDLDEVTLEAGT